MQKKSIKNIHLYPVNNKFNKNILSIEDDQYNIFSMASQSSIYKYLYTNEKLQNQENIKDNIFIINSSVINNESIDFINNFHNLFNIWIFVDNESFILNPQLNVRYITNRYVNNFTSKILPNNIVDKAMYSNVEILDKLDQLVYFFSSNTTQINSSIEKYLYPASNLRIKLFDNNQFNHPQNLGYLTERDRSLVLLESKFYICDNNNYYLTEAMLSGCIVLNIDDEASLEEQMKSKTYNKPTEFIYYIDFLGELANEK